MRQDAMAVRSVAGGSLPLSSGQGVDVRPVWERGVTVGE